MTDRKKYYFSLTLPLLFFGEGGKKGVILPFFLLLFLSLAFLPGRAQQSDPTINVRSFDEEKRKALVDDPTYLYDRDKLSQHKRNNAGAENRANNSFWDFILKDRVLGFSFAEMLLYLLGIFGLLFFIITFLKIDVRGLFVKKAMEIPVNFEDLGPNLESLDFEGLINQARQQGDYRSAVRLVFLETLKILTTAGHIRWKINKTNQDYLGELRLSRFREEFADLTLSYEYVWYGDYEIDEKGFDAMEKTFQSFQQKVAL